METDSKTSPSEIELAGEELFNFAIEREDVKWLINSLSVNSDVERAGIEHELQLLKIISVGWSISYWLEKSTIKTTLAEKYWKAVYDFSENLSQTAELMIGHDIDFFQTVRKRLDTYVQALSEKKNATEPAAVIGPEFARLCGKQDDLFLIMSSSRMFITALTRVKNYLDLLSPQLTKPSDSRQTH